MKLHLGESFGDRWLFKNWNAYNRSPTTQTCHQQRPESKWDSRVIDSTIKNNQSFMPHLSPVPDIRSPLMTDVLEWLTKKIFESPWTCWSQFTVCVDFKVIATLLRLECVFLICLRKWQNIEINEKKWYLGFWMRIEPQKIK